VNSHHYREARPRVNHKIVLMTSIKNRRHAARDVFLSPTSVSSCAIFPIFIYFSANISPPRASVREEMSPTSMKNQILPIAAARGVPVTIQKVHGGMLAGDQRMSYCYPEGGHYMMHLSIRRAVRCTSCVTLLLLALSLFVAAGITCAATVGDQVELKATHQAGVPFHNAPGGSQQFQRVPSGTVGTVIDLARGGSWLQLRLADQRTGWIAARYVGRTIAGSTPPTSPGDAERRV
jgi:hypothetical protein